MYSTKPNGKTVLVGMTGRTDSTVAAYLLRKQGYSPIGVGIVFYDSNDIKKYDDDFFSSYHLEDLNSVKQVCEGLEIPFYAVNAADVFKAMVLDKAVAARLGGEHFNIQNTVTSIIVNVLIDKMKSLNADCIATGHYARIQFNRKTNEYTLISANEPIADQSYAMASLDQKALSRIILPLSDIRLKEVEKISETMGVEVCENNRDIKRTESFFFSKSFVQYVENNSPPSLRMKGPIIDVELDSFCADHSGVHRHYIGEREIKAEFTTLESRFMVAAVHSQRQVVYVAPRGNYVVKQCALKDVVVNKKQDVSIPLTAFIQFGVSSAKLPCTVYFKCNSSILIELDGGSDEIVAPGSFAVIYSKEGSGAKIIGGGTVSKSGDLPLLNRVADAEEKDELMDEASDKKKVEAKFINF
ncbi:MAG: hypothetical protein KAG61_11945 [Bacteriovoracaceae bacterium]|nr:hypothetical protein [Bacteriovoracaceae bacterium]